LDGVLVTKVWLSVLEVTGASMSTTHRLVRLSLSLAMVATLAACGGGGKGSEALNAMIAQRKGSLNKAPTVSTTEAPATLATLGTLVLNSAGGANIPVGTYTLDTTSDGLSQAVELSTGTLIAVQPESSSFDTGLYFMQGSPSKFVVGFVDATPDAEKVYACRSNAWGAEELQELAITLPVGDAVLTLPICPKGVSIDASGRTATYSQLLLPNVDGSADQVNIDANYNWPVPAPEAIAVTTAADTPAP
jgi:hypothetical protein